METIQMIQKALGDNARSEVQIKLWRKHFKDGRASAESDLCSSRPATSRTPENIECVQAALNKDQPLTVVEIQSSSEVPPASLWVVGS